MDWLHYKSVFYGRITIVHRCVALRKRTVFALLGTCTALPRAVCTTRTSQSIAVGSVLN